MPQGKKNPNQIPEAHAKEDKNTPGDDTGEQIPPAAPTASPEARRDAKRRPKGR